MISELLTLTDTSDGFATALIARGPGTGINRMQLTLRNEPAISAYGYREAIADFADAVDETDLQTKALARLAEVSDPAKHQELTVRVTGGPQFALGQRIRVSDGELGFSTTAKITGIDSDEASTTLTLGDAPGSLLDVINKRDAEERRQIALGLPPPTNVEIIPAPTGLTVLASVGLNSRAVGMEVHVSASNGFIPDRTTLAARGPGSRFEIEGLPTAIRQFVRLRAYDDRGNFSPWTDQISAAPRGVGTAELVVGQIDITNAERPNAALSVKTSAGAEVLRLGNIAGKAGVPVGVDYGLWGALGTGIFIQGSVRLIDSGFVTSTPSGSVPATSSVAIGTAHVIRGATTIPAGKKWLGICVPQQMLMDATVAALYYQGFNAVISAGGSNFFTLPAGTYPQINLNMEVEVYNRSGSAASTPLRLRCGWLLVEVDA